jgi:hypothetical protein
VGNSQHRAESAHLSSIPLIVGFIDKQGQMSTKRTFAISLLFAGGILITIAAVGVVTAAAGRMMGDVGRYGNYFVAAIFFLVGLYLLDIITLPWSGPGQIGMKRKGMLAAFILGLIFGIAVGPCTFAYMAPMLAVTSAWPRPPCCTALSFCWPMASAIVPSSSWPVPARGSCSVISIGTRSPGELSSSKESAASWSCSPACT